jgi:hypothetical protein
MNLADFTLARWRERRRNRRLPDFADMGTAFGLDASFAPTAPAAVMSPDTGDASVPAAARTGPARWWSRRAPAR